MVRQTGYKKYMKNNVKKDNSLLSIFLFSFLGMLLLSTFVIKSFLPTVDTTVGDYKPELQNDEPEVAKIVDERLKDIQDEDQGISFNNYMDRAQDIGRRNDIKNSVKESKAESKNETLDVVTLQKNEPIYKVFVGNYSSIEQARVAKDIISESVTEFSPIVKCIGANEFTLQVGIFKNKQSADALLLQVQQNHLPGRIVQDY